MRFALPFCLLIGLLGCSQSGPTPNEDGPTVSQGTPMGSEPDRELTDGISTLPDKGQPDKGQPVEPGDGDNGAEPRELSAQEALAQAARLLGTNPAESIKQLEAITAKPNAPAPALLMLVQAYNTVAFKSIQDGDTESAKQIFFKAGKIGRQYLEAAPDATSGARNLVANTLYNEACAHALSGEKQPALDSLKQSFELGFDNIQLAKTDKDLSLIQGEDAFKSIIESAEVAARERAIAAVKSMLDDFTSFPFTFTLPDLDGKPVSLDELKGKVVIVDIWGTWCPPCRAEIPHFIELRNKYHEKGLDIIGLNYERGNPDEAPENIRSFATENKMNYVCLIGDEETRRQVPDFQGYPTTLFIDRTGKVRLTLVGLQPYAKLEAVVEQLLAEES